MELRRTLSSILTHLFLAIAQAFGLFSWGKILLRIDCWNTLFYIICYCMKSTSASTTILMLGNKGVGIPLPIGVLPSMNLPVRWFFRLRFCHSIASAHCPDRAMVEYSCLWARDRSQRIELYNVNPRAIERPFRLRIFLMYLHVYVSFGTTRLDLKAWSPHPDRRQNKSVHVQHRYDQLNDLHPT